MNAENITEREGLERLENLVNEEKHKEAAAFAGDLRGKFPSSYQIGHLYYQILVDLERYSDSETLLDELLKKYPENIKLLLEKGTILINRGKMKEGRVFFDKVLFLDPFNPKAKEGIDFIKKRDSDIDAGFTKPVKERVALEDTMKESDLEKFMSSNGEARIVSESPGSDEPDDQLDISLAEGEMEFERQIGEIAENLTELQSEINRPEEIEVEDKQEFLAEKMESILDEMNRFSPGDMDELGLKNTENAEQESGDDNKDPGESFITESAALLYLKQGLFMDARDIYDKLYKGSDEGLYTEKMNKLKRIEIAAMKIKALEGYMNKIKAGSMSIV